MQEINQVELFFPGLRRQNVYITDSDNIVDETQVLIVGSSVSIACMRIKNALKMRCPDLLVDTQAGRPYTPAKIKCRVAIICVDNRLSDTVQAVSIINSLHEHGITMIPIIFEDYVVTDCNNWWPMEIPCLSSHKLFVDIRSDFHSSIKNGLIPVLKKYLNQWHGKTEHAFDDTILCDVCKIDCVDNTSHFSRVSYTLLLEEWYSKILENKTMSIYEDR